MRRAIIGIFGLVAIGFAAYYFLGFQTVNIDIGNASTVKIYKHLGSQDDLKHELKPTKTVTKPGTYRLAKGRYVYTASVDSDHEEQTERLTLTDYPQNISISLPLIQQKSEDLAHNAQPEISQILSQKYGSAILGFYIDKGRIYQNGKWYATKLIPKDPNLDTYKVVFKKSGSKWELATDPPQISLYQGDYTDIPLEVLTDINNF